MYSEKVESQSQIVRVIASSEEAASEEVSAAAVSADDPEESPQPVSIDIAMAPVIAIANIFLLFLCISSPLP